MHHTNRKGRRKKDGGQGSKKKVKFKGVQKNGKKFNAYICIDRKRQGLGSFDIPKEAAKAYDRAAIQAGRPTSKLNFLNQVPKDYKPMKKGLASNNTTGYTGVYKNKGRFLAQISIGGGKQQNIGMFGTAKEAAEAYDQAALQAKFPRSKLNFSDTPKEEVPRIKKRRIGNCKDKTGLFQWSVQDGKEVPKLPKHKSTLMAKPKTLATSPNQETSPWRTTKQSSQINFHGKS